MYNNMVSLDTTYDIEYRKANGIYYTPEVIVDYMVREAVGRLVDGRSPGEISGISIVDPACGDGNFLVGVYKYLVEYHKKWYDEHKDVDEYKSDWYIKDDILELTETKKQEILLNNIYGVDIDQNAINHAKIRMVGLVGDIDLSSNIKCGNSLIGTDYFGNSIFKDDDLWNEIKPFNWNKEFPKVFQNGGFDIVIGNPPYIRLRNIFALKKEYINLYKNMNYKTFDGNGDIYCLFYERGIKLLKNDGILCYISPNKWIHAKYGKKLRTFFMKYNPLLLIDICTGIFENATVDTCIFLIQKAKNNNKYHIIVLDLQKDKSKLINIEQQIKEKSIILSNISKDSWFIGNNIEQKLKEKMDYIGIPIKDWDVRIHRGISTGFNDAFIINSIIRQEILNNCRCDEEKKRIEFIIKPMLCGKDIKRYYYNWNNRWIIIIPTGWTNQNRYNQSPDIFIKNTYPSLMNYLKKFEYEANKRYDKGDYWWEIHLGKYYEDFNKEKIIYSQFQNEAKYALDKNGMYLSSNEYMINGNYNKKYFLAILNSKIITWYLKNITGNLNKNLKICQKSNFIKIPIPPIIISNESIIYQIESLVDKILAITNDEDYIKNTVKQEKVNEYEYQIDEMVYKLYDLNDDEIKIINKL